MNANATHSGRVELLQYEAVMFAELFSQISSHVSELKGLSMLRNAGVWTEKMLVTASVDAAWLGRVREVGGHTAIHGPGADRGGVQDERAEELRD